MVPHKICLEFARNQNMLKTNEFLIKKYCPVVTIFLGFWFSQTITLASGKMIQHTKGVNSVSGHKETNFLAFESGLDKSTQFELLSCVEQDDTMAEVIGVRPVPPSRSASMNSVDGVVIGIPMALVRNELDTGKKLGRGLLPIPMLLVGMFRLSQRLVGIQPMDVYILDSLFTIRFGPFSFCILSWWSSSFSMNGFTSSGESVSRSLHWWDSRSVLKSSLSFLNSAISSSMRNFFISSSSVSCKTDNSYDSN